MVVAGPDAVARLLWPPTPDALAEAYLRGDIEIQGDIWTAVEDGSLDVAQLLLARPSGQRPAPLPLRPWW